MRISLRSSLETAAYSVLLLACTSLFACGDDEKDGDDDPRDDRRDVTLIPDVSDAGDPGRDVPAPSDATPDAELDGAADVDDDDAQSDVLADAAADVGSLCGNGDADDGEECDDGNLTDGDGCDATCVRETSLFCAPCALNSECNGSGDLCVDGGCALDCSDWDCPLGSACEDVAFGSQTLRQCVPASGSCFPSEDCGNGLDDDGNGRVDCDDAACALDVRCGPGTAEDCGNLRDDDGDGLIDCGDGDCDDSPLCVPGDEQCANGLDDDGDGLIDCGDGDCADSPLCVPGEEQCANGLDDDGDGLIDCGDGDCAETAACESGAGLCDEPATVVVGSQTGSTTEGESRTATTGFCGGAGPEVALTFVAPESRTYCADTFGSSFDTVLSIRTACALAATEEHCNDDTGGTASQIEFRAIAGESLTLVLDGFGGFDFGPYTLNIVADVCSGGTGGGTEICDNGFDDDGDFLRDCEDSDCADEPACAPPESACLSATTATLGAQSTDIPSGESTHTGTCAGDGAERVWTFTPATTGDFCATTAGSDYDTVLYVRSDCENSASELACNDDSGGQQSRLTFPGVAGVALSIFTDSYGLSGGGSATLTITAGGCTAPGVELCDNGFDDDDDGDIDCEDFGCRGDDACPEICDNDVDDDGDFSTDCRDDDCADDPACIESLCDDGLDNDGDFWRDCDDTDCDDDPACIESLCDDGLDNDGDFWRDCDDTDCDDDPACEPLPDPCSVAQAAAIGAQGGEFTAEDSQYGASCRSAGDGGEEQVWEFSADSAGLYCVDTVGSDMDTVLSVRGVCSDQASELACNDDQSGGGTTSQVEVDLEAFQPVWLIVDTFSVLVAGDYTLNIASGACP
jgi:hypothetical protein